MTHLGYDDTHTRHTIQGKIVIQNSLLTKPFTDADRWQTIYGDHQHRRSAANSPEGCLRVTAVREVPDVTGKKMAVSAGHRVYVRTYVSQPKTHV
jgi:hypothetical protein